VFSLIVGVHCMFFKHGVDLHAVVKRGCVTRDGIGVGRVVAH